MKRERRTFKVELRKSDDGRKMRGTAVVFNQLSENLGGFREQIDPAAFDAADISDVRCLFNHDDSMVLGRTSSGTLTPPTVRAKTSLGLGQSTVVDERTVM